MKYNPEKHRSRGRRYGQEDLSIEEEIKDIRCFWNLVGIDGMKLSEYFWFLVNNHSSW
jgi:hypothetical protein